MLVNEWTFYLMHGLAYAGVATFYGASVYLVVTGEVYVARRLSKFLTVGILVLAVMPGQAEAKHVVHNFYETRRICHTMTASNHLLDYLGLDRVYGVWQVRLCADFEFDMTPTADPYGGDHAGHTWFRPVGYATMEWIPLGASRLFWSADSCQAHVSDYLRDGTHLVIGWCNVKLSMLSVKKWDIGTLWERNIYAGFQVGPRGYIDYHFPSLVVPLRETAQPLPLTSPADDYRYINPGR